MIKDLINIESSKSDNSTKKTTGNFFRKVFLLFASVTIGSIITLCILITKYRGSGGSGSGDGCSGCGGGGGCGGCGGGGGW